MRLVIATSVALLFGGWALAESNQPYAGMQARGIKALSEQQIGDLRAGKGMGLALAAELNGYPGPAHVLGLSDQIGLSAAQRDTVQGYFDAMKAETVPIGESLIAKDSELDRQFSTHAVTPATLQSIVSEIGALQAKLRAAHLKYHLSTAALLTKDQTQRYVALRGYANTPDHIRQH